MFSAALLSLVALPAHALSWAPGFERAVPADGSADVPLNVMPVVEVHAMDVQSTSDATPEHALVLVDVASADVVPAQVHHIGSGLYQIWPDEVLGANRDYAVVAIPDLPMSAEGEPLSVFTTGELEDHQEPTIPEPLGVAQESHTDEWGDWHSFLIDQRPAIDPVGVVYAVEVETLSCALAGDCGAPPLGFALGGVLVGAPSHDGNSLVETLRFSDNPAGEADPLALQIPEDSVVRVHTMDLAGNNAALVCSVPQGVEAELVGCEDAAAVGEHGVEPEPGDDGDRSEVGSGSGGCAVVGATPAVALAMVSLGAVARRRRSPML